MQIVGIFAQLLVEKRFYKHPKSTYRC